MKESEKAIFDLHNISDCGQLDNTVRYVTVDIANIDTAIISYLVDNGNKLLFTDRIGDKRGFVYVDYNTFASGQKVIDKLINDMPKMLNELEKARYLYVSLGKLVGYDINVIESKNEFFGLNSISCVNNIWNALATGRANYMTFAKVYLYLCSIFNIECEIVSSTDEGYLANKITIDGNTIVVNIAKDVAFIQAGFPTTAFASFNREEEMDKKIGYIKSCYNDKLVDRALSGIDYLKEDVVVEILLKTQKIINVDKIKPVELGVIYRYIFDKYCPNYDIVINNLYINDNVRQHFIMISYGDKHYSYNYKVQSFVTIEQDNLIRNLDSKRIGLYADEFIPNLSARPRTVSV